MEKEIWKPIKDFEGYYEVSNIGRVRSLNYKRTGKEKILKNTESNDGYLIVGLTKNGKRKQFKVHRLVAEAFIPNPENKPCIDHINTVRSDNRVENLRWVSYKENSNNEKTLEKFKGENHHFFGKHHTEETKQKMSEAQKGENNHMYGKHHTEETKKKMSEAQKGEKGSMYGKTGEKHPKSKSVVQIDQTTNEVIKVWGSTREAERIGGFCHNAISECCKNKFNRLGNNIYKGFKWMYLEDYEKLN